MIFKLNLCKIGEGSTGSTRNATNRPSYTTRRYLRTFLLPFLRTKNMMKTNYSHFNLNKLNSNEFQYQKYNKHKNLPPNHNKIQKQINK